jgi:deoxyribose-phosphate aldolase
MKPLNTYIDHTQLKATTTQREISQLCKEALQHGFYAVCVNGCYTAFAKAQLLQSPVKIATVVGFPLGAITTKTKVFETKEAILHGADEIDMVLNIGALKSGDLKSVEYDIAAVRKAAQHAVLKVIFENCYLTDVEKRAACQICLDNGVDFIKTSTGFGTGGATLEDVQLMKNEVGNRMKIKASGGIRDQETALKYIELGIDRIGTSSGIQILHSSIT